MKETNNDVIPYIIFQQAYLNPSQKKIADYIISQPEKVIQQTSKEIAETLAFSEATIVRFCKKIGFKGYKDFKLKLAQNLGNQPLTTSVGISPEDNSLDVVKKALRIEYEDIKFSLDMLDEAVISEVLKLIHNCRKIVFFGVGSSSLVASAAKEHFLHYKKSAYAETEGLAQLLLANTLDEQDVAFAISTEGASKLPIKALEIATKNGAKTICLTQDPSSPLAKIAQLVIQIYRKDSSIDGLGTVTRIVPMAIIDALSVAYATTKWDSLADFSRENRENYKDFLYGE